jgi:prespore-specific regulator
LYYYRYFLTKKHIIPCYEDYIWIKRYLFGGEERVLRGRRWKEEEDALLKEAVLRSISSGQTQLAAFAEVGKKLGRTVGACGFRWNAVLRKKNIRSYTEAKKQRVMNHLEQRKKTTFYSFSHVIQLLKQYEQNWKELQDRVDRLKQELQKKEEEIERLQQERERLVEKQDAYQYFQKEVKERYKQLFSVIQQMEKNNHQDPMKKKDDYSLYQEKSDSEDHFQT